MNLGSYLTDRVGLVSHLTKTVGHALDPPLIEDQPIEQSAGDSLFLGLDQVDPIGRKQADRAAPSRP